MPHQHPIMLSPSSPYPPLKLHHVVIAGGSISGLMHALVLKLHSPSTTKITLLERSPSALLHNQGAGVVAGSETQEFFEKYVCPGRELAVHSWRRLYLDRRGGIVDGSVVDWEQKMTSWDVLYRLLRYRVDGLDAGGYLFDTVTGASGRGPGSRRGSKADVGLEGHESATAEYRNGCVVTSVEDAGLHAGVRVKWTEQSGESKETAADLLIAADGASSAVRGQLLPDVKRKYAGYVAFRGTVPESQLSPTAADAFVEKFTFFHTDGIQILAYLIPGEDGTLERGKRLTNWVWYCNYEEGSHEYVELMTDKHGKQHAVTLPVGGMKEDVWTKQKKLADDILPPQFAELVHKTERPFVQAITDVISPENVFLDCKVLLVGDALAGFRPHTAASTSQAAFDALMLADLLQGRIDRETYRERVLSYARGVQRHGVMLGERSQFGRHPLAS